jgi:hypothetical protein
MLNNLSSGTVPEEPYGMFPCLSFVHPNIADHPPN